MLLFLRFFFCCLSFLKWAAIACVGVLIDDSVIQLFLFTGIQATMFIVLVTLKPFANRYVFHSIDSGWLV